MRQALAGMLWTKQYYFFDADKWLEEHGVDPFATSPSPRAQPRVGPHGQRRRHLHARQVGVPLVRGLGPGLPRDRARRGGRRLREAAARPDAAGDVPPPERPDPGLRVELQRREPARASLGHALPLPDGAGPARGGRRRLPQALLQQAARQLHLVGEPQGPLRKERLRGRLPRPRQHRGLRPLGAAAHRRPPRAGRRHGLDGALQPEHAGDGRRDRRLRRDLRGPRRASSSTTSSGSPTP